MSALFFQTHSFSPLDARIRFAEIEKHRVQLQIEEKALHLLQRDLNKTSRESSKKRILNRMECISFNRSGEERKLQCAKIIRCSQCHLSLPLDIALIPPLENLPRVYPPRDQDYIPPASFEEFQEAVDQKDFSVLIRSLRRKTYTASLLKDALASTLTEANPEYFRSIFLAPIPPLFWNIKLLKELLQNRIEARDVQLIQIILEAIQERQMNLDSIVPLFPASDPPLTNRLGFLLTPLQQITLSDYESLFQLKDQPQEFENTLNQWVQERKEIKFPTLLIKFQNDPQIFTILIRSPLFCQYGPYLLADLLIQCIEDGKDSAIELLLTTPFLERIEGKKIESIQKAISKALTYNRSSFSWIRHFLYHFQSKIETWSPLLLQSQHIFSLWNRCKITEKKEEFLRILEIAHPKTHLKTIPCPLTLDEIEQLKNKTQDTEILNWFEEAYKPQPQLIQSEPSETEFSPWEVWPDPSTWLNSSFPSIDAPPPEKKPRHSLSTTPPLIFP